MGSDMSPLRGVFFLRVFFHRKILLVNMSLLRLPQPCLHVRPSQPVTPRIGAALRGPPPYERQFAGQGPSVTPGGRRRASSQTSSQMSAAAHTENHRRECR